MAFDKKKYMRKWRRKHAKRLSSIYKARRDAFLELHGNKCARCGEVRHLVVDHIDPSKKKRRAANCWRMSPAKAKLELDKCQVLCFDCHVLKSVAEKRPTNS